MFTAKLSPCASLSEMPKVRRPSLVQLFDIINAVEDCAWLHCFDVRHSLFHNIWPSGLSDARRVAASQTATASTGLTAGGASSRLASSSVLNLPASSLRALPCSKSFLLECPCCGRFRANRFPKHERFRSVPNALRKFCCAPSVWRVGLLVFLARSCSTEHLPSFK